MASPRSGWRGTMTVRSDGIVLCRISAARATASSSPGCVLAARKMGRPATRARNSATAPVSTGGGGASYFRLPTTMVFRTPSSLRRLAKCQSCVSTRSKREKTGLDRLDSQAQRLLDLGDMRPLTSTIGIFLSLASTIRFGQISDSVKSARSGRQCSMKRRQKRGLSSGMN